MDNTNIFLGKAQFYNSRPTYAPECVDFLYQKLNLSSSSVIADIGAGTGILSKQFLDKNCHVISIEPNSDMYQECKKNLSGYAKSIQIQGSAEKMPIPDKSVDLLTVGTAFHWFDKTQFKNECRRVLKNGAYVAIMRICNNSDGDKKMEQIHHYLQEDYDDAEMFFGTGNFIAKQFEYSLEYDLNREINHLLSSATAPLPEDEKFQPYVEKIKAVYEKYFQNKPYQKQLLVELFLGTV